MRVGINSSTGLAERISKATWGSQPQKSRIRTLFHKLWLLILIIWNFFQQFENLIQSPWRFIGNNLEFWWNWGKHSRY